MRLAKRSISRLSIVVAAFLTIIGLGIGISGQEAPTHRMGVVDDWSHHHLVFSNPGTAAEALAQGRVEEWYRIVTDPRYKMQQMKRNAALAAAPDFPARAAILQAPVAASDALSNAKRPPKTTLKKDWNVNLGAGGTVGAGNYPAKFTFNSAASCSDFAVFNTSLAGSSTSGSQQATVMAFTNLYSGCTTMPPSVAWAYDTTNGDKVVTGTILSLTGNQVAFISTDGTSAYLNVLLFKSGQGTAYNAPVSLTPSTTGSVYSTCKSSPPAAGCLLRVKFANGFNDITSSPFYDYDGSDILWVGDANGNVHKFTGVFNGSPAESGNAWASVGATTALTSPVFDGTHVFVGGANGYLYSILASSAVSTASGHLAAGLGISDVPLVDASAGELYVLVGDDRSLSCSLSYCSGVFQLPTTFGTGATGNEVKFGGGFDPGTNSIPLYQGTFDNIYYTKGASSGNLFLCTISYSGTFGGGAFLVQVPTANFGNGNAYGSYLQVTATAGGDVPCSPVSEILSGGTDWLFLSVASNPNFTTANSSSCSGKGCLYNFNIGNGTSLTFPSGPTDGFGVTSPSSGSGTSGIIIDNSTTSGSPTGAKIYFTPMANGSPCASGQGCAVQVSQSTLQ